MQSLENNACKAEILRQLQQTKCFTGFTRYSPGEGTTLKSSFLKTDYNSRDKMNQLEQLKRYTTVVADTGSFQQLGQFKPQDATTNPSLILKAVQQPQYQHLLVDTATAWKGKPLDEVVDRLLVKFGCEILSIVPGACVYRGGCALVL